MARSTRTPSGAGRATTRARTGTNPRRGTGSKAGSGQSRAGAGAKASSGQSRSRSGKPRSNASKPKVSTTNGARGGGGRTSRPAGKRRNPNRWRFYVLLVLLGLIVATVLWFTVGRDAVAGFMDESGQSGAEETDAEGHAPDTDGAGAADEAEPADDAEPPGDADAPPSGEAESSGTGDLPVGEPAEPDEHALANPVECRTDALEVHLDLGTRTHQVGDSLPIQVTVSNTGPVPCLIDLGHESMQVEITSGNDGIWSSTDCPSGHATRPLLLDIDAQAQHTVTWSGQRCGSGTDAQEGTYRVGVAVPATGGPAQETRVLELT